jgi:hypothetical protein
MTTASWTWMIYLATHNNAASAGEESVERMRQALLCDDARVLVQQSTPGRTVRRIIGDTPELVADLGQQVDSGGPETLIDFVRWAAATAPAKRYALVLWSHGSGWGPSEMERLARQRIATMPVTVEELTERGPEDEGRQVFFSTTMRELLAQPTPAERATAFDDGSGHSLDTIELGQIAAQAAGILDQPLDLLGMNACQMGNVEVAYQVRGNVRVYVASEEDMPVQSWPYDDILTRLAAQPDVDADALGRMVVERYCAYFRANPLSWGQWGLPQGVTLSAVHLDKVADVADAARSLAAALQADISGQLEAIWGAHREAHAFKFRLYDLASFCLALAAQPEVSPASLEAAQAMLAALDDPSFLLARDHTSSAYDDVGGLTTYLMPPSPVRSLSPYYAETDYAHATGWSGFLATYHAAVG